MKNKQYFFTAENEVGPLIEKYYSQLKNTRYTKSQFINDLVATGLMVLENHFAKQKDDKVN